ncbi:ATP-binding protein [Halomonas sp. CH40]
MMKQQDARCTPALIDDLEQVNAHMLQSEKLAAIGQLAAGVAHEINSPIGYVSSNLATLSEYLSDILRLTDGIDKVASLDELKELRQQLDYGYIRDDIEQLVAESNEGIQRVKRIVMALKDFSHIEDETFRLADLHDGLDTTLNLVSHEIKHKAKVSLEYADLPQVECMPSQINQVALNLLTNAAHAVEVGGQIILRTGRDADSVWFEVEDNGHGVAAENVDRLFEPFFTTKPKGEGTGLGLALSYSIVCKHHGCIEAFSAENKGSRFRVCLPITQPAHEPTLAESP